jgi:hypothetical protein
MLILGDDILNISNYLGLEVFSRHLINKNNVIHLTNIYETDNKYDNTTQCEIL